MSDGILLELFYMRSGILRLGILELYNVGMLHIAEVVNKRTEEDIGIAFLGVLFGYRTVELVVASHGKRESVHEIFSLLMISLG